MRTLFLSELTHGVEPNRNFAVDRKPAADIARIPKKLRTGCDDESRKVAWPFYSCLSQPLIAIDKAKFLCHIVKAVSKIALSATCSRPKGALASWKE